MSLSAFADESHAPEDPELRRTLGPSAIAWDEIRKRVAQAYAPVTEQWHFSGPKYGWSLRLKQRERVIVYLTPQSGHFLAGVVVGAKAAAGATLSEEASASLADAPRYAEGIGVRLEITRAKDASVIHELLSVKMARPDRARSGHTSGTTGKRMLNRRKAPR